MSALKAYEEEHADSCYRDRLGCHQDRPTPQRLAGVDLDRAVYDLSFYRTFLAGPAGAAVRTERIGFLLGPAQPEFNLVNGFHRLRGAERRPTRPLDLHRTAR